MENFWTELQEERAKAVLDVVKDLEDYWPLTVRQIHYRLVEKRPKWFKSSLKRPAPYENTLKHYQDLSRVLKWMRIDNRLAWSVLTDRTRRVSDKRGVEDLQEFVGWHVETLLKGYDRCLMQSQDVYVELWVEKEERNGEEETRQDHERGELQDHRRRALLVCSRQWPQVLLWQG